MTDETSVNGVQADDDGDLVHIKPDRLLWAGRGGHVNLRDQHGRTFLVLHDPLTYLCQDHADALAEPAAMDGSLPVAGSEEPVADRELGYWPRYGSLEPSQRRLYLQWLASGRTSMPAELGYVFLFIYGLERRALLDRLDAKLVFDEILSLRALYWRSGLKISHSFEGYTQSLLWFLPLWAPGDFSPGDFGPLVEQTRNWNDDRLAAALAWLARDNRPLPVEFAFPLAEALPRSAGGVVMRREGARLRELFEQRYRHQHPEGLTVLAPSAERDFTYRPSSAALPSYRVSGPNPWAMPTQFNVLSDLWNGCVGDLRPPGRIATTHDMPEVSPRAWRAPPDEPRRDTDHPLLDQVTEFIERHTGDASHTIVPVRDLATLAGIAPSAKLNRSVCRQLAETLGKAGYCIEPDPRFTGRTLTAEEPAVLFLDLGEGSTDAARYFPASVFLEVGIALAGADGHADEGELSLLSQTLDANFALNDNERRRLDHRKALRVARGIELTDVLQPVKELGDQQIGMIAKFALSMVLADGVLADAERKAVRRLYGALGLPRERADADLAALMAPPANDEPVTVARGVPASPGERIPPPAERELRPIAPRVDREALAACRAETAVVALRLAEAMGIGEEPEDQAAELPSSIAVAAPHDADAADAAPPRHCAAFFEIMRTRPQWTREDLKALADGSGVMLDGAIDAINAWSVERHGGPLVYEEDGVFALETEYLE